MSDDQIDDLKQFVAATVSQSEARLVERIDQLEKKMEDGFAGVGDVVTVIQEQLDNHETRLTKLEPSPTAQTL